MKLQKRVFPSCTFRSLFAAVAGVFMLMVALVPRANATVLVYFNFEDGTLGGAVDFTSDVVGPPDFNPGAGIVLTTITTTATVFASADGLLFFFFSSRRRHTRFDCDWSSDVCSSD